MSAVTAAIREEIVREIVTLTNDFGVFKLEDDKEADEVRMTDQDGRVYRLYLVQTAADDVRLVIDDYLPDIATIPLDDLGVPDEDHPDLPAAQADLDTWPDEDDLLP